MNKNMCKVKSRLFVALVTFGIGVIVTSALIFSIQIPKVEVVNSSGDSISTPAESKLPNGEIEIKYKESLTGVGDFCEGIFSVTNNTDKIVYYFGDSETNNLHSWIKQNGKIKYIEIHKDVEITERELKANESTYFWIPSPLNEKPFEAGFILTSGDERKEQTIVVEVQKQIKHP